MIFKVGNASEFPTAWKVDCISFFFVPLRVSLFRHFCFTLSMCYSFFVFPSSFLIIYFLIPWDPIHFLTFKQKKTFIYVGRRNDYWEYSRVPPAACGVAVPPTPLYGICLCIVLPIWHFAVRLPHPHLAFTYVIVLYVYVQGTINISSTGVNAFESLF